MYLITHSDTGYFKEKNGEKYLIIDSTDFFLELDQKLKHLIVKKNCFMKKKYAKIGINTDDDLPLKKHLKFPTLIIITRCVFQEGEKMYPQFF